MSETQDEANKRKMRECFRKNRERIKHRFDGQERSSGYKTYKKFKKLWDDI